MTTHQMVQCDNPTCVNPDHLFLGTYLDNIKDRDSKGRGVRGEGHPKTCLTNEQVLAIRKSFTGSYRGEQAQIARDFGVTSTMVHGIVRRKWWTHI